MHPFLRYLWFIGDGDSLVYNSLITGVPTYGYAITKVECADHRNCNSAFCKHVNENPESKLRLHYSL